MTEMKRVLITGANGLIGRSLVATYSKNGWNVIAHTRRADSSLPNNLVADLSAPGSGTSLIHNAGRLDCVINNAANQEIIDASLIDASFMEQVFRINVGAPTEIMIAAKSIGASTVLNISSVEAINPRAGHEIYGASKAALESLTKSFSNSLAPMRIHGIRLGLIGDESLTQRWPEGVASWKSNVASKRYGTPEEVAELALAMSTSIFAFATGAIIDFDGGKNASPGW